MLRCSCNGMEEGGIPHGSGRPGEPDESSTNTPVAGNSKAAAKVLSSKHKKPKRIRYPPEIELALDNVKFIADHLRDEDRDEQVGCIVGVWADSGNEFEY